MRPQVVQTYDYRVVHLNQEPPQQSGFLSPRRVVQETHIIMELCDRGSLQDAMKRSAFLLGDSVSATSARRSSRWQGHGPAAALGQQGQQQQGPAVEEEEEVGGRGRGGLRAYAPGATYTRHTQDEVLVCASTQARRRACTPAFLKGFQVYRNLCENGHALWVLIPVKCAALGEAKERLVKVLAVGTVMIMHDMTYYPI